MPAIADGEGENCDELANAAYIRKSMADNPKVEVVLAGFVVLSAVLFAVETLPGLSPMTNLLLTQAEAVTVIVFAVEFAIRWYSVSLKPAFLLQPLAVIDLLSFLPFLILLILGDAGEANELGGITTLRLLRVLRLQRFVADAASFERFQLALGFNPSMADSQGRMRQEVALQLARVASSVLTLVFVATGLIYQAEHVANPQIPDYFTAVYFGLTTLTTVGFGDISPVTAEGRLVVALTILVGAAVIPIQLAAFGEAFLGNGPSSSVSSRSSSSFSGGRGSSFSSGGVSTATGGELAASGAETSSRRFDGSAPLGEFSEPIGATLLTCRGCGESVHLSSSLFCCRCGLPLPLAEIGAEAQSGLGAEI